MKQNEIDQLNENIREMRGMIEDVRSAAVTLGDGYAEAMANVASDCLARLVLKTSQKKRR